MVKQRMPQSVQDSRDVQTIESKFISGVERDNLAVLSLDELADRFEQIEQQGQLLQGKILLEARNRFQSDNEFGAWVESVGGAICSTSRQHRTRLMNLARFFEGRELNKISISAAYEISAPANADIAIEVYELAKGKGLPLAEVRRQISIRKGENLPSDTSIESTSIEQPVEIIEENKHIEPATETSEKSKVEIILQDVLAGLTSGEKIKILGECLRIERQYPAK